MSTELHPSRWSRPLVALASVAVIGAGLGAFFGIRAVQGSGSAPSAGQPPARVDAAMTYDAANGTVVLFGGQSRSSTLNDTWIWDGSGWTQAQPGTSPPRLDNPQATYDPVTHDVVLVGGQQLANHGPIACSGGSGSSSSGSGGSTTTFIPPGTPIPAIAPAPSATSNVTQGTPVTSPGCATLISPSAVTWLWNGSDWSKAPGSTPYIVFGSAALATDPVSGRVVLLPHGPFAVPALGAAEPAIACPMQSTAMPDAQPKCPWPMPDVPAWTWNGHAWKVMTTGSRTASFELFSSSIVDDAVSGKLATFGGNVAQPAPTPLPCNVCAGGNAVQPSASRTGSESIWTGTAWKQVITYDGGPAMPAVAFVGDPASHNDVVLTESGQTWLWTGVWTRAHPGTSPPIVSSAASTYDAATGQVVMFGGAGATSRATGLYDQTWTWNGSDWTRRGGSEGPSVTIPVPSPASIPPGLPCEPIVSPAQPAGSASTQAPTICKGSTGSGSGSSGSGSGSTGGVTGVSSGSGVVAP